MIYVFGCITLNFFNLQRLDGNASPYFEHRKMKGRIVSRDGRVGLN